jgi:hypothetical protein
LARGIDLAFDTSAGMPFDGGSIIFPLLQNGGRWKRNGRAVMRKGR